MPQADFTPRRRSPLAVRLSLILMLAAVIPLLITVIISEYYARPALITQANQAMATDALTRVQLINTYLSERLLDAETLTQVPTVQEALALPPQELLATAQQKNSLYQLALFALGAGEFRDKHYIAWTLFNANQTLAISYPQQTQLYHYGPYVVPPEDLEAISNDRTGAAFLSPVYYNASKKQEFIDIYSPVYVNGRPDGQLLGFMRASLNMAYIQGIVQSDQGFINHSGSAFILDQNGVRIADTNSNSPDLFTAVAPPPQDAQPQITNENQYGQNGPLPIHANSALAAIVKSHNTQNTFTFTPSGQSSDFQAISNKTTTVPWTYFVVSPSSAVTQVADDQLQKTIIVAIVVALLAALIGFWVSSRISRPIRRSVDQLRENSEALNGLAKKQQSASSEQLWVVDAIQVGLQSVQYYTDATRIAAHKLGEIGTELENNWYRQNIETIKRGLQHVIGTANYIEKATHYQGDSSQKLSTAVKVTTQVNEQLADGAISATEAASQLEQVVNDLRSVIGQ